MLPREHGAYGQLLFPLLTALAVGRRTLPALLLASAAVLVFLAHEPLLVLLGQRGPRAAREQRSRAAAWLGVSGGAAAVAGVTALVAAPAQARVALIAPVILGAALAAMIAAHREHTTAGEILAASTFASLAYPIARAGGASSHGALSVAAAFGALFIASTVCVHGVIKHTRRPPARAARAAGVATAAGLIAALWWASTAGVVSSIAAVAALPASFAAAVAAIVAPSARQLRVIGWTLIATTFMAAAALILALG